MDLAAKERAEGLASPVPATSSTNNTNGSSDRFGRNSTRHRLVQNSTAMESIQATSDPVDIPTELPPGGIPARNHKGERLLIFLGIIDILQSYRFRKKLEHTLKAMIHDGDTVSVHRPGFYAERFMNFMSGRVFKKIPSPLKNSPSKRSKSMKIKSVPGSGSGSQVLAGNSQVNQDQIAEGENVVNYSTQQAKPQISANQGSLNSFTDDIKGDSSHRTLPTGSGAMPAANSQPLPTQTSSGSASQPGSSRPDVVPTHGRGSNETGLAGGRETSFGSNHFDNSIPSRSLSTGRVHRASSGSRTSFDRSPSSTPRNRYNSGEVVSINDIRLEHAREHDTPSKLSVAISSSGRTGTPTWTEGTPSFTESSVSEFGTPARSGPNASQDILRYDPELPTYTETEMVYLYPPGKK